MTNYKELIGKYRDIEMSAHIELDDTINKVTQECGEIIEARDQGDNEGMWGESKDALVNVLSAVDAVGIIPDLDHINKINMVSSSRILVDLANWNIKIQGYRNRYSRQKETMESVLKSTHTLIEDIMSFSQEGSNPLQMLGENTHKFQKRVGAYLPNIELKDYIKSVSDFPKKGIDFKDISPLLANEEAMRYMTFKIAEKCKGADIIAGLDARGFLFGERVAELLGKPFVMIRKAGKLPGDTYGIKYGLEYGNDEIEIQRDSIEKGQKVALVDDLLATGGTMEAAVRLVEKSGGEVENVVFAISLNDRGLLGMDSRSCLEQHGIESILEYN